MENGVNPGEPKTGDSTVSALIKGVRLDLVIAVSALLVSSLATAASWWQTRASWQQTQIIEEQLSAQVWPYVGFSEDYDTDAKRLTLKVENDGLGPAVIRNAQAFVDGKPQPNFIAVLHALLGPHIGRRIPHGEKVTMTVDAAQPGTVLRPGISVSIFSFGSKTLEPQLLRGYQRLSLQACYCAIIPGKCWQSDSQSTKDPQPVASCPEIRDDLMHASAADALSGNL